MAESRTPDARWRHLYTTQDALRQLSEAKSHRHVSTGFPELDKKLGGAGLWNGLYVIGAPSSMGKSTLVGQIAENIALQRRKVLFVTLEQSAEEMAAKGLSRQIYLSDFGDKPISRRPITRDGRSSGSSPSVTTLRQQIDADSAEAERWRKIRDTYEGRIGDNLWYLEPADDPVRVDDVADAARYMMRLDAPMYETSEYEPPVDPPSPAEGESPIIIIDYLQVLTTSRRAGTERERIDGVIDEIVRKLVRSLETTVLAISSLNRASYKAAISMESFKESGKIEYSADVLIGLEEAGLYAQSNESGSPAKRSASAEPKAGGVRDLELTVLKNRLGSTVAQDGALGLTFDGKHNVFSQTRVAPCESSTVLG